MKALDIETDIGIIMANAEAIEYLAQNIPYEMPYHLEQLSYIIMSLAEEQQRFKDRMIEAVYRLEEGDVDYEY